jgi:hypothetical protein
MRRDHKHIDTSRQKVVDVIGLSARIAICNGNNAIGVELLAPRFKGVMIALPPLLF